MIKRISAPVFLSVLFAMLSVSSARAQAQRTFVSGLGNDSNACTRIAPCRTIAHALMGTNAGGEVVVLDSAGYGPFVITQAVSIIAPPGVYAGISVFSGDGVDINAGASDTVVLRGLTIINQGGSGNGVLFSAGGTLHVENCVVNGFPSVGVSFQAAGKLEVKDTVARGNGIAIDVFPSSGSAQATIDHARLEGNIFGLRAREGSNVTAGNSIASANTGAGFDCFSATGASAEMNIESCVASNNGTGIAAISLSTGVATVRVSNSTATDNNIGLANNGSPAVLLSRGNNTVEGNTTNTSGTIGSYTAK